MTSGLNINFHEKEQNEIAEHAAQLFRKRVVGNMGAIIVENLESRFLAVEEADAGENFPGSPEDETGTFGQKPQENLTTIDVLSVVKIAIYNALLAKDMEVSDAGKLSKTDELIALIGERTMTIINTKGNLLELDKSMKERIVKYRKHAENTLQTLHQQSVDVMSTYYYHYHLSDGKNRQAMFEKIHAIFVDIEKTIRGHKRYFSNYVIGIKPKNDNEQEIFAGASQGDGGYNAYNELYDSGEVWKGGENGEVNAGIPALFYTPIHIPALELRLVGFLPRFIRESSLLKQDTLFEWEGRDTGKTEDRDIKRFPIRYKEYLGYILRRQLTIYTYSCHNLHIQDSTQTSQSKIPGRPMSGNIELRKSIALLRREIKNTIDNIKNIDCNDTAEKQEFSLLSEKIGARNLDLKAFFDMPHKRAELVVKIIQSMWNIEKITIGNTSLKFRDIRNVSDSVEGNADAVDIHTFIGDCTFPSDIPCTISAPLSLAERSLMEENINNEKYAGFPDIQQVPDDLSCELPPETNTSSTESFDRLVSFLGTIIVRKLMVFFATDIRTKKGDISKMHRMKCLKQEIHGLVKMADLLDKRIEWSLDPDKKSEGLQVEIDSLRDEQFHALKEFLTSDNKRDERYFIAIKIQNTLAAIDHRTEEQELTGQKIQRGNGQVNVEKMTEEEKKLKQYLPTRFQKEHPEIFKTVAYFHRDEDLSEAQNAELGARISGRQFCERALTIYFFAQQEAYRLENQILDNPERYSAEELKKMKEEETIISGLLPTLKKKIADALKRIESQPFIDEADYIRLFNHAGKTISQIDAIQAYTAGKGGEEINEYWKKIQFLLTYFRRNLKKGVAHRYLEDFIKLQSTCCEWGGRIISWADSSLRSYIDEVRHDTTPADEMIVYLEDVMTTFFIPRSGEKNKD